MYLDTGSQWIHPDRNTHNFVLILNTFRHSYKVYYHKYSLNNTINNCIQTQHGIKLKHNMNLNINTTWLSVLSLSLIWTKPQCELELNTTQIWTKIKQQFDLIHNVNLSSNTTWIWIQAQYTFERKHNMYLNLNTTCICTWTKVAFSAINNVIHTMNLNLQITLIWPHAAKWIWKKPQYVFELNTMRFKTVFLNPFIHSDQAIVVFCCNRSSFWYLGNLKFIFGDYITSHPFSRRFQEEKKWLNLRIFFFFINPPKYLTQFEM
jgi:hypothetical protein